MLQNITLLSKCGHFWLKKTTWQCSAQMGDITVALSTIYIQPVMLTCAKELRVTAESGDNSLWDCH